MYHPVPVEEKSPRLAAVLNEVANGRFGDGNVYEPCVPSIKCVFLTTELIEILQAFWILLDNMITICLRRTLTLVIFFVLVLGSNWLCSNLLDLEALEMIDEAYANRTEWLKKSISTSAKVWHIARVGLLISRASVHYRWASSALIERFLITQRYDCVFGPFVWRLPWLTLLLGVLVDWATQDWMMIVIVEKI